MNGMCDYVCLVQIFFKIFKIFRIGGLLLFFFLFSKEIAPPPDVAIYREKVHDLEWIW
jgi:hypothetical protein